MRLTHAVGLFAITLLATSPCAMVAAQAPAPVAAVTEQEALVAQPPSVQNVSAQPVQQGQ